MLSFVLGTKKSSTVHHLRLSRKWNSRTWVSAAGRRLTCVTSVIPNPPRATGSYHPERTSSEKYGFGDGVTIGSSALLFPPPPLLARPLAMTCPPPFWREVFLLCSNKRLQFKEDQPQRDLGSFSTKDHTSFAASVRTH